jgi:lambda repressor-like predicted transcriptional regulator
MRRWLLIIALVAGLALGTLGGALVATAQDQGNASPFSFAESFLDKLAQRLGIGRDQLEQAMRDAANDTVNEALSRGVITEDQAQRLRQRIQETAPRFPWGPKGWHKGPWGHKWGAGLIVQAAADVLGMTPEDVVAQLREGKSLAQVSQEKGMSLESFRAQLLEKVGQLIAQRADQLRQQIEQNIDDIINAQGFPPCPWQPVKPSGGSQSTATQA